MADISKKILEDYIDACAVINDTEEAIKKLDRKKRTIIQTNVKGSNPDWPYESRNFTVQGTSISLKDDGQLRIERQLLAEQKQNAEEIKLLVEQWLNSIPCRMQRIIRYKIFKDLTWEEVAALLGRKCTGESVRKEYMRFMGEK